MIILFSSWTMIVCGQTVWSGPKVTFTKIDDADWLLRENQDSLTENVILTRGATKSLFNIAQEPEYNEDDEWSPIDTEWAIGHSDTLDQLTFDTWKIANGGPIKPNLNENLVVHLLTDDIYIDLYYTSWSGGGNGGFSYVRSSDNAHLEVDGSLQLTDLDTVISAANVVIIDDKGRLGVQSLPSFSLLEKNEPSENQYSKFLLNKGQVKNSAIVSHNIAIEVEGNVAIGQLDTISDATYMLVFQPDSTIALSAITETQSAHTSMANLSALPNESFQNKTQDRLSEKSIRSFFNLNRKSATSDMSEVYGTLKFIPKDISATQNYIVVVKSDGTLALQNLNLNRKR